MKRVVKTTMVWDFSGTETVTFPLENGHPLRCYFIYIKSITTTLLGDTGSMRVEFFLTHSGVHASLENKIQKIVQETSLGFVTREESAEYPNLHISTLKFKRQQGRRFTETAMKKFLAVLEKLDASNELGWPIPKVTLETFTDEDGQLISEGDWLATQFYPINILRR